MSNKLELTWYGKDEPIRLEPRLLIENTALSNYAALPGTENMLIHMDSQWVLKTPEQKYTGRVTCVYVMCYLVGGALLLLLFGKAAGIDKISPFICLSAFVEGFGTS